MFIREGIRIGFLKKLALLLNHKKSKEAKKIKDQLPSQKQIRTLSSSLDENLNFILQLLGADVVTRKFQIAEGQVWAGIIYISGIVDKDVINKHIVDPLMTSVGHFRAGKFIHEKNLLNVICSQILTTVDINETQQMEQIITAVLSGSTVIFVDCMTVGMIINTAKFEKRSIETPETETTVWGSREGFIEDVTTNISMLRRRLPTPDLQFEKFVIGRYSRNEVRLVWIEGVVNPKIIEEARRRLQRIDIDYVFGSGLISELISDNPTSIWPQVHLTERPDIVAANLVEGRFAVFCSGDPFVVIAPTLFWQNLQTLDDYAEKPLMGIFFRLIRHVAFYVSLMATPIYVATVTYHPSILPPPLAMSIAASREGVPFPSVLEVLTLSLLIDLLRESSVRLPRASGGAVTFLGAVVIGQAAVTAGFVSPAVIIIIAITAIANYTIPGQELAGATRIANYFLVIWASILGLFGVTVGMVWLLWAVVSLRSFGIPLFYPMSPNEPYGLKDIIVRGPVWRLRKRPSLLAPDNQLRMGDSLVEPKPKSRRDDSIHD